MVNLIQCHANLFYISKVDYDKQVDNKNTVQCRLNFEYKSSIFLKDFKSIYYKFENMKFE